MCWVGFGCSSATAGCRSWPVAAGKRWGAGRRFEVGSLVGREGSCFAEGSGRRWHWVGRSFLAAAARSGGMEVLALAGDCSGVACHIRPVGWYSYEQLSSLGVGRNSAAESACCIRVVGLGKRFRLVAGTVRAVVPAAGIVRGTGFAAGTLFGGTVG